MDTKSDRVLIEMKRVEGKYIGRKWSCQAGGGDVREDMKLVGVEEEAVGWMETL